MKKPLRQVIGKVRDKTLGTLTRRLEQLEGRLERIESHERHVVMRTDAINDVVASHSRVILPISEREIVAKLFNGLKIYLDPRDLSVAVHMAMDGIWEHSITKAWMGAVWPGSTVFDVGANFGYFGVLAAQRLNSQPSRVVMFEPNPNLLPYINKTLSANWLRQHAKVEHLGVAEKSGEVELTILKDYIGCSSLHSLEHLDDYLHDRMDLEVAEKVLVKTTTIDEYCDKNGIKTIDLMKVDVEGYEANAYAGMRAVVKRSPDMVLFLEFTRESYDDPKAFFDLMVGDFGYVHTINEDGSLTLVAQPDYDAVFKDAQDWKMLVLAKRPLV